MAYAKPRSANNDLRLGMVEGGYKMAVKDRGGVVEALTYEARRDLTDGWYGIHEAQTKMTPDGQMVHVPCTTSTPEASPEAF